VGGVAESSTIQRIGRRVRILSESPASGRVTARPATRGFRVDYPDGVPVGYWADCWAGYWVTYSVKYTPITSPW
jgi:hypothetical protein